MVTGRVPFEGETPLGIAMKHKSEMPKDPREINAQIPEDLSRVILRCLEKDKDKRFQRAGEVRAELENIEKGIPTTEREIPKKKPITSREITVTFDLKKILIPSLVVMVTVVVALIIWSPWAKKEAVPTTEEKLSIAVLPFEDLSPKKDQEYFCNGLADSIIHALTNINELRVLGRNTSLFFKEKSMREIGKMLNVERVLKGSLQKTEKDLRITAQLLKVADESILWSEQFNRAIDDVFIIQDVITHSVVESLTTKFLGDRRKPIIKRYTEDKEAYELYLKGRFFWEKRGKANALKAIEYFQEAIEIDPVYALAYSGLSDSYTIIGGNGLGLAEESFPQAKAMALKALEMDDHLAEAHASLAMVLRFYEHDFAEAEKHFKKAITLNPNYVAGHYWYSDLLSDLGRHKEAIEETLRAKELDPFSGIVNTYMWWTYYHARDFGKAIEYLQNDARLYHENRENYGMIAKIYVLQGRYNEAQKLIEQAYQEDSEKSLINTTHAYVLAACGRHDKARRRIDIIIEKSKHIYISPVNIALIYIGLGDFDQAFIWLEKGFALKDFRLVHLKKAPEFDSIRSKPRFNALLKKIGLERRSGL
jgi:TolB-like protein/Tfp pilus assembly protein PilF